MTFTYFKPFNWICPYCNTKTTINEGNQSIGEHDISIKNIEGQLVLITEWIVCPNEDCLRTTLIAKIHQFSNGQFGTGIGANPLHEMTLLPKSSSKQFPEYIPQSLIEDYEEAASIKLLSPKASATLARRCLQGMVRDFWNVSKPRLVDEINAIENLVDPVVWKSIDAVRKVGNIGAHMEKDINLVIDVDPNEANLLIELIEMLFEEWYIHRYERNLKLEKLIQLASEKEMQKKVKT